MLQDIQPHVFNNAFLNKQPKNGDYLFHFYNGQLVLKEREGLLEIPTFELSYVQMKMEYLYLFSIDNIACFLCYDKKKQESGFALKESSFFIQQSEYRVCDTKELQKMLHQELYFICITAEQIYRWMKQNRFCGACKSYMLPSKTERALVCSQCGHTIYPTIPPAAIVAIVDGDRIFLARGKHYGAGFYSLIAGYTEIGETLEQTAEREVYEETGLKIKNIKYYASQPWPGSGSLMVGFIAQLDGSDKPKIDYNELAEAHWFYRDELPEHPSHYSIAAHMLRAFKNKEF